MFNRICDEYPEKVGMIFQYARRIVIGIMQNITEQEYFLEDHCLFEVDTSISTEFSTWDIQCCLPHCSQYNRIEKCLFQPKLHTDEWNGLSKS